MPLGKVLLRKLKNLFCQKFQLPKAAFDNLAIVFCKSHRQTFVRHIQRHVGAIGLQISQISSQTNILLVLLFVCDTISIQ
jgi:hypothetical protein